MELSATHLLLIKLDTNDGANYDINRNTVCLILQDSGLCSIFSITFIKHSKVMSNCGLFPQFLYYTLYRKPYILALVTMFEISAWVFWLFFFKAILCCLSFPPSIWNPALSLSQVSTMGALLLITLGETLNHFMYRILLWPKYIHTSNLSFLNKLIILLLFLNTLVITIHITSP